MFNQIREWLSIELINLGIKVCPYPEMQDYIRSGIGLAVESYLEEDVNDSDD